MMNTAGDEMSEMRLAVDQTEAAAKEAQTAIGEAMLSATLLIR